jgi:tetratricopeptide (TPR) repeat protein
MTKIFLRILFTCSGLVMMAIYAQQSKTIDSLLHIAHLKDDSNAVDARIKLFWEYSSKNLNLARAHLDTACFLQSSKENTKWLADINRGYGFYYSSVGLFDKAEKYYNISKEQYEKTGNKIGISDCLNGLGILEGQRGNLDKALQYYMLVEKLNIQLGNENIIAKTKINIGLVYYMLGENKKADEYYEKAYEILRQQNDLYGLMHVYSKKATNYLAFKEYAKALDYLYKSRDLARKLKDSTQQLTIEQNIGSYYIGIGKPDSALIQYYNYKALGERMGLKQHVAIAQLYIGLGEYELGHHKKAIEATKEGIALANEVGDSWRVMNGYNLLSEIYQSDGNYKLALEFNKLANQLDDSLKGVKVANRINELQAIYDLDEKENENKILQEQNIHKQLKVKQLYTLIIGLGILLFSIIIFVPLFVRQRRIKSRLKQSELEQKALRAQMNPHFIFNALIAIQSYLFKSDPKSAGKFLSSFAKLMRGILENSREEYISVDKEIQWLENYVELQKLRFDNRFEYTIEIDPSIEKENLLLPPMLTQPFIENALEHGLSKKEEGGNLLIRFTLQKKKLSIQVMDNGIGFDSKNATGTYGNHRSLAIQITHDRLKLLNKRKRKKIDFNILSEPGKGTTVSFSIPVREK